MKRSCPLLGYAALGLALATGPGRIRAGETAADALARGGTLSTPAPAGFAVPSRLSLEAAVRLTLAHHPLRRAQRGRVEAAAGRADQARRWPNPELTWSLEDGPTRAGSRLGDAKHTVGMAQTFPFPGKKRLDHELARTDFAVAAALEAWQQRELVREVKAAFYRALAAERFADIAAELAGVAEASATQARQRVEAGAAPRQEQLRAEIAREQARAEQAEAARDQRTARQTLAALLGGADLEGVTLEGDLEPLDSPDRWDAFSPAELASHPALEIALLNRLRAERALARARLEPYPDLTLGVAGGREGVPAGQGVIEVQVALPLPLLDRARGRQREARAEQAVAEAEAHTQAQALWTAWVTARERFRTAAEQARRQREEILPRAEEALRLVQLGFAEGRFALLDLLDTQRTVAETRRAYWQTVLEWHLARTELEALTQPAPTGAPPTSVPHSALNSD